MVRGSIRGRMGARIREILSSTSVKELECSRGALARCIRGLGRMGCVMELVLCSTTSHRQ